jgi:hypothetical protein
VERGSSFYVATEACPPSKVTAKTPILIIIPPMRKSKSFHIIGVGVIPRDPAVPPPWWRMDGSTQACHVAGSDHRRTIAAL